MARDADNVYFYVETADKPTPATDRNWMMLFIDVDRDKATGMERDFIVNRTSPHGKKPIEKNVGGRMGSCRKFAVNGNKLELAIAKTTDEPHGRRRRRVQMERQHAGNIMDFYVNETPRPDGSTCLYHEINHP